MRHISVSITLASIAAFMISVQAHAAYYGVLDNGEVQPAGQYKVTTDVQALTKNGGLNLGGTFDMGFNDEFGLRALLGFGKTDFFAGAMFKWMPIPDLENQPAIGVNLGVVYANDEDIRDMSFRAEPLVSKRLTVEQTVITPYAALPVSVRVRDTNSVAVKEETRMAFQLVIGSQLQIEAYKNLQFIAEIGLDLDQSPGYVSMGAVWYFDKNQ